MFIEKHKQNIGTAPLELRISVEHEAPLEPIDFLNVMVAINTGLLPELITAFKALLRPFCNF